MQRDGFTRRDCSHNLRSLFPALLLPDWNNAVFLWGARRDTLEKVDFDKIFVGHGDYAMRLMVALRRVHVEIHQLPSQTGKRKFGRRKTSYLRMLPCYWRTLMELVFNR